MRISQTQLLALSRVLLAVSVTCLLVVIGRFYSKPAAPRTSTIMPVAGMADLRPAFTRTGTSTELPRDAQYIAANDPFAPTRTDSPATPQEAEPAFERQAAAVPAVRLTGTIQYSSGEWLALVQRPGGEEMLLRVGQAIDDFRIKSIKRGHATIASPDTTLILRMP